MFSTRWHVRILTNDRMSLYCNIFSAATEDAVSEDSVLTQNLANVSVEDKALLARYHHGFDDEKVDIDLMVCLLYKLHSQQQEGIVISSIKNVNLCMQSINGMMCKGQMYSCHYIARPSIERMH